LVQGHECLCNLQHKDCDNSLVKDSSWKEIAGELHAQDEELSQRTQHCRRMAGERHGACESAFTRSWCGSVFCILSVFALHVILVCVVLVGAETAVADRVLERDGRVLAADCVAGCLLHPVEECKEVSQGKPTNLSSSTLYSVNVTAVLVSNSGYTVCLRTTAQLIKLTIDSPTPFNTHTHTHVYLVFCGLCIMMYLIDKYQQDALFR
jgi:hypothetical protein